MEISITKTKLATLALCVFAAYVIVLTASIGPYQGADSPAYSKGRIVKAYYENGTVLNPSLSSDPIMVDLLISPSSEHLTVTTINSWLNTCIYAISCTAASIIILLGVAQVFFDIDISLVPFYVIGIVLFVVWKLCLWYDGPHPSAADTPAVTEPSPTITEPTPAACS